MIGEDVRFFQLKEYIYNIRNVQASRLAQLAIDHPSELSAMDEYWRAVTAFQLIDKIADRVDKIENHTKE